MGVLEPQARRFFSSAESIRLSDPTGATILYFKSWFVLLDAVLLERFGRSPKDHTERFQLLRNNLPEYYALLDKYYPLYRDTYTATVSMENCNEIRDIVRKLLAQHAKED